MKQSKSSAGYIHDKGVDYLCNECKEFIPDHTCAEVAGKISGPTGGCNKFKHGKPKSQAIDLTQLTKDAAGYMENSTGFSCKRCTHFNRDIWDCTEVNKNSPGPDSGYIDPDACCDRWQPHPVFANF